MAKGEVDEAMKELKAKLEEKAESKPAAQPDEDQRKLFVGGLAQVRRICFQFNPALEGAWKPRERTLAQALPRPRYPRAEHPPLAGPGQS